MRSESELKVQGPATRKHQRIALCHLESLVCLPAINRLFSEVGNQIGLVILSDRFGGKHGGALRQFLVGVRRSGLRLTLWLGFDILSAKVVSKIATALSVNRPTLKSVRALAREYGAQVLSTGDINGRECSNLVRSYGPDIVLVMNFDQILRQPIIDIPGAGVLNVHPSLLPFFRGPCPVLWALMERSGELGVSLHLIDGPQIDSGPIVSSWKTKVGSPISVGEATALLFARGASLFSSHINYSVEEKPCPQSGAVATYRTFPSRAEMAKLAREGVRLCSWRHLGALICDALRSNLVHWQ